MNQRSRARLGRTGPAGGFSGFPSERSSRRSRLRSLRGPTIFAFGIVLVLLLPSLPSLVGSAGPAAPIPATRLAGTFHPGIGSPSPSSAHGPGFAAAPLHPHPTVRAKTANAAGLFFVNQTMPFPGPSEQTCIPLSPSYSYPYPVAGCFNETTEPSLIALPAAPSASPRLALAYTALANTSNCPRMGNYTSTLVAFTYSSTGGASWTAPSYLGPSNCTAAADTPYPSAWQPTLAVLSNGTIAMAYVQYNLTFSTYWHPVAPYLSCQYTTYDRLVFRESYNNGSSWTTPRVIAYGNNTGGGSSICSKGSMLYRPSLAATGQTLYLAYQNITDPVFLYSSGSYGSAQSHFVVSTDGGRSFGAPILLKGVAGIYTYYTSKYPINATFNPRVTIGPSGQLLIAYVTAVSGGYASCSSYCIWNDTGQIYVARSTNNGTTLAYANAGTVRLEDASPSYFYPASDPVPPVAPEIAFSPNGDGRVYIAVTSFLYGTWCSIYSYPYPYCSPYHVADVYVVNSTDNGTTWGSELPVAPQLLDPNNGYESYLDTPSVAVSSDGTVFVQFGFTNGSVCLGAPLATYLSGPCAPHQQFLVQSTDHGGTFSPPVSLLTSGITGTSFYNTDPPYWWYGEYTSMVADHGDVFAAYATEDCPLLATGTYCAYESYNYATVGQSRMVVSYIYTGPTVTLTFNETGLPAGSAYSVNAEGNVVTGPAGSPLTISGVPNGMGVTWTIPWVNRTQGVAFYPTGALSGNFTANSLVKIKFNELLEVQFTSNPPVAMSVLSGTGYWDSTVSVSPNPPSIQWVAPGTNLSFSETAVTPSCSATVYCLYYNVSFVSWSGTGVGAVNSNASSIIVRPTTTGINETVNLQVLQLCQGSSVVTCTTFSFPVTFHEAGLPSGTTWTVRLHIQNFTTRLSSTSSNIAFSVPDSVVGYDVLEVPGSSGNVYVPTNYSIPSPFQEPMNGSITLRFLSVSPSTQSFSANVTATGLPGGTNFAGSIGNTSWGTSTYARVPIPGGTSLPVTGLTSFLNNGTAYYAQSATIIPQEVGASWKNVTLPTNVTFNASSSLIVHYAPEYLVSIDPTTGGSVAPGSAWVHSGSSYTITATPDAGYYFVGWTGVGPGATNTASRYANPVQFTPSGPVTELATFRPIPPATWNITVVPGGLPTGVGFSIVLGSQAYSGFGNITLTAVVTGSYPIYGNRVISNVTNGTRYVPVSIESSLPMGSHDPSAILIDANGTVWINYTEEYALTIAASPFGTVLPGVGTFWERPGTVLNLTGVPSFRTRFGGWNGTGAGSATSLTGLSISVRMLGPVYETALFIRLPRPPAAVFWLSVTETGLPDGTNWNISAGSRGASGTTPTLQINGLNGSYPLSAAPVLAGPGARWGANLTQGLLVSVSANGSYTVSFAPQFLLRVTVSSGGSSNVSTGWYGSGSVVALSAIPEPLNRFVAWSGSGDGAVASRSAGIVVTLNGPVSETANFAPIYGATTTGSASDGLPIALGLLALLAAVGLAVGLYLGARGGGRSEPVAPTEEGYPEGEAPPEAYDPQTIRPIWDEDDTPESTPPS